MLLYLSRHAKHSKKALLPPLFVVDKDFVNIRIHRCDRFRQRNGQHRQARFRIRFMQSAHDRSGEYDITDESKIYDKDILIQCTAPFQTIMPRPPESSP